MKPNCYPLAGTNTTIIELALPVLEFDLEVKPLSVNKAWRGGKRYRTDEYLQLEKDVYKLLPRAKVSGPVVTRYDFYIVNFKRTDVSNLIKVLEDIMVKAGIIDDDCNVITIIATKHQSIDHYVKISISPAHNVGV